MARPPPRPGRRPPAPWHHASLRGCGRPPPPRAAEGADLDDVIAVARRTIDATRSIGIGLSACTIPAAGKPNFTISPGTMEVGIGHHGEPGVAVMPARPARNMAALMLDAILPDLPFGRGEHVAVLVSGLGATPVMELYILYKRVAEILAARGRNRDGVADILTVGVDALVDLGGAKAGDKSLLDVALPALDADRAQARRGGGFTACLAALEEAARHMVARIGRVSRLGERSRGHHDAGAASCRLLLVTLARGLRRLL